MRKTSEIIWQDKQHQVLFEVIDEVAQQQRSDQSILQKLQCYAENHFAIEEEYMIQLEYPGREEHIRAHDQFREELNEMVAQRDHYDHHFEQLLSTFLTEWLTRHVFGIDKNLERFILESDVK